MGTLAASTILVRAGRLLYDQTHQHWPEAELLDWLNDGQWDLVTKKPDAYVVLDTAQLVAGTVQTLPATGLIFQRLLRNRGTDGTTVGSAITGRDLARMDLAHPDWHTHSARATVKHTFYDPRDPTRYYVYPPQPTSGQGYVDRLYAARPAEIAQAADPITLDDIYRPALLNYVLYRAYDKQSKHTVTARAHADRAYAAFLQALGLKDQAEGATEPNGGAP